MFLIATLSRVARLLALISPRAPAEIVLRRELTRRRDLAPSERRDIARAVAVYFRWRRWLDERAPLPRQVGAALALQARFDARASAIKPEALAARAVPEWIWAEMPLAGAGPTDLSTDLSAKPLASAEALARTEWLRQLQRDPPLWIRARREFAAVLPRALGDCEPGSVAGLGEPGPGSTTPVTTAFRYTGPRDLFLTEEFRQGWFEVQDLASQLAGHACAPRPGETWWDACAGEGGKLLHLADLMQNQGLIWASDRSERRLHVLRKRAARARVFNYRAVPWNGGPHPPTKTRFDGILVDAPCSGVGTWQRHPDARWTTSPADVRELAMVQRELLEHVAGSLKPGGRLVYAVCTLTRTETAGVVDAFSAAHPELEPVAVFPEASSQRPEQVPEPTASSPTPGQRPLTSDLRSLTSLFLWPHEIDANGMFIAAWRRRS
jgi:16S rRNA (cytosine967-C5)-methyltransferase